MNRKFHELTQDISPERRTRIEATKTRLRIVLDEGQRERFTAALDASPDDNRSLANLLSRKPRWEE